MLSATVRACALRDARRWRSHSSASNSVDTRVRHPRVADELSVRSAHSCNARPKAARIERRNEARASAARITYRSFCRSVEACEYAGETGQYGMPTHIAASASERCSMLLPDRMTIGRSAREIARQQAPRRCAARARACSRYVTVIHAPSAPRRATQVRSGATRAQCFELHRSAARVVRASVAARRNNRAAVAATFDVRVETDQASSQAPSPHGQYRCQAQRTNRVLLQNQIVHFGLEARFLEVLHPAIRRDRADSRSRTASSS